jgi:hypothetical protein
MSNAIFVSQKLVNERTWIKMDMVGFLSVARYTVSSKSFSNAISQEGVNATK